MSAAALSWPTAADLAGLPGLPSTRRGIAKRAQAEQWRAHATSGRGGPQLRYDPATLPAEIRLAWAGRAAGSVASRAPALPVTWAQAQPAGPAPTAPLREREAQRTRVLVLFQRWWQHVGGALCPALQSFAIAWTAGRIEIPAEMRPDELRAAYPRLAWQTVRGWWVALQSKGTLARDAHPRRGQYEALSGEVGTATLAILGERPHLTAAAVRRLLAQSGFDDLPSERAFQRALQAFKAEHAAAWLAHTNPDGWRSKYLPADGDAAGHVAAPNDEWQLDSTVGDCMLVDPETGEIRRHHIVAVIDVFTRRAMFLVTRTSKANAIMALLRRAIATWGVPRAVKTDNGADYTAQSLEFALLQLGIEHRLCAPFNPQQKPFVERVLGTLLHGLFPMLTGFVGHSVTQRKAIESATSFAHRLFPPSRRPDDAEAVELRLAPSQLQTMVDHWTADYLDAEHSTLGTSPNAHTQAHLQAVRRCDDAALALFLMPVAADERRRVSKKGISLGRGWYTGDCLAGLDGQDVRCRISEDEIGRVHVFDIEGRYLGVAEDKTRLGVTLKEVSAKRKAHAARVNAELRDTLKAAKRAYDVDRAVRDVYLDRQADAIRSAPAGVVTTLPTREQLHTTPAISAAMQQLAPKPAPQPSAAQAAMQAAMDRLEGRSAAVVFRVGDSPNARYSMWIRQRDRVSRGEALTPAEARWHDTYCTSAEYRAMDRLHAGTDPLAADG